MRERVILDLCAGTGAWSQPYVEAGYDVRRYDIKGGDDVRLLTFPRASRVHGILAAPPCTYFCRMRMCRGRPTDAQFLEGLSVVDACLRTVMLCEPTWWALENPQGYLSDWLGPPMLRFDPRDFGDPWTKRTWLWGKFAKPTPVALMPLADPLIHRKPGKRGVAKKDTENAITPPGFARAFFEANPKEHPMTPVSAYRDTLARRFAGVLSSGKHAPDGVACALEAASIAKGLAWTDDPTLVGLPDLRTLNDACWSSDAARTAALVPVVEALWGWASWQEARRVAWAQHVTIATVRDIVSEVVPEPHASACRRVTTCAEARAAHAAAAHAAADAAARAAAAAYAAARSSDAATARAARDRLLTRACAIWIEAVEAAR